MVGRTCSPIFLPTWPAYPCTCKQGQLYCTAEMRCRNLFPECFTWQETGAVLPSGVVSEGTGPTLYSCFFLAWPLMISGAADIKPHLCCIRGKNPDMGPGCSPGPDITMALSRNYATRGSSLFTIFPSTDRPLSTGYEPFGALSLPLSLSLIYHTHMGFLVCSDHGLNMDS